VRSIAVNLHANFHDTPADAEFMITDRIRIRGASDFDEYVYAVSRNVGRRGEEEIPKATLLMVDDAGHFVQFEASEVVNPAVAEFIAR
jgi:pimeloyl-ACP methyl ester carboxylesterase